VRHPSFFSSQPELSLLTQRLYSTDPITTGREELGFCKLYADLPDAITEGSSRIHTASWFGKEFLRLEISGLVDTEPSQAPAHSLRPWTHREWAWSLPLPSFDLSGFQR
jgi:hypothetical protein